MHIIPTHDELVRILHDTGALRHGHFISPEGLHSDQYVQVPIAMRHYQYAKMLSVSLSRLLRANPEIRAMIPELSIVSPATGGLPVAYGVCEALQAKQVYWAEPSIDGGLRLRQYVLPKPGELVVLVDDILRSGTQMTNLRKLMEGYGATIVAMAVVVHQPTPNAHKFTDVPFYSLLNLDASYFSDSASCDLCRSALPAEQVWN